MQNYSTSYFLFKCISFDSPFQADHEYLLIFLFWQHLHGEKCKKLRECKNQKKNCFLEKLSLFFSYSTFSSHQYDFQIPRRKMSLDMLFRALSDVTCSI